MRRAGLWIFLIALIGGVVYAVQNGFIKIGANASVCREDDEIDKTLREDASKVALGFVDALLKPDAAPAYQQLTAELKSVASASAFAESAKKIQGPGPFSGMRIDHLYEPSVSGTGSPRVLCGSLADTEHWVAVETKPGVTQVYVVLMAATRNNDWAFTLWLIKDSGAWHVHGYYLSMASMAGHFPAGLLAQAREQEKKGHTFNSQMLFVATGALINRGPSFQLGLKQELDGDLAKHKTPAELSGNAPFSWRLDGKDYSIETFQILGVGKQLVLTMTRRDRDWDGKDQADAERRNKLFLDAFIKTHPEYKESFGALVARVLPANGEQGWGTVFDAAKGYQ